MIAGVITSSRFNESLTESLCAVDKLIFLKSRKQFVNFHDCQNQDSIFRRRFTVFVDSHRLLSYRDQTESWMRKRPFFNNMLLSWQTKFKSWPLPIGSWTLHIEIWPLSIKGWQPSIESWLPRINGLWTKSADWQPPAKSLRDQTKSSTLQTNSWLHKIEIWQCSYLSCMLGQMTE